MRFAVIAFAWLEATRSSISAVSLKRCASGIVVSWAMMVAMPAAMLFDHSLLPTGSIGGAPILRRSAVHFRFRPRRSRSRSASASCSMRRRLRFAAPDGVFDVPMAAGPGL